MQLISQAEYRVMPWKNGGGSTTEIHVSPAGAVEFDWRVSIATVNADGPFSVFAGYERHILVLEGNGMTLAVEHRGSSILKALQPFSFAGDARTFGTLTSGPVRDFNLMVNREFGTGSLCVHDGQGPCTVGGGSSQYLIHMLGKGSVLLEPGEVFSFPGSETMVICEISPHSRRAPAA